MTEEVRRAGGRRCRRRPQARHTGELRPTDVVGVFFIAAVAFFLAAVVAGVIQSLWPWPWGRWLALHLAFVGGVSQLILGASQFFTAAFLATDPPPRALVRVQLITWNVGAALLAFAVPNGLDEVIWIAVGFLLVALVTWITAIVAVRRQALRRSPWASRWYLSAIGFLGLGLIAGSLLAYGTLWNSGDLLASHMVLNLGGCFGAAIVGTLHTFYPSLTGTQLRFPRLQGPTFIAWCGGVAALAIGYAWSLGSIAIAGWIGIFCSAAFLATNVLGCFRSAARPLSLSGMLVGIAQGFLLAGTALVATLSVLSGPAGVMSGEWRDVLATLFVIGWIGLTVMGSLLHLLAVVVRVRGGFVARMPLPRPQIDLPLTVLGAMSVACLALAQTFGAAQWETLGSVAVLATYAALGAIAVTRAARLLSSARPSF